jgi:uncharacterized protein
VLTRKFKWSIHGNQPVAHSQTTHRESFMNASNTNTLGRLALSTMILVGGIHTAWGKTNSRPENKLKLVQAWDKTFPQSKLVTHRKVTFTNRYGIVLAGDLYEPKAAKGALPALAISGPFGAVKEQSSGLYAQTMAERGYIALAFDPSFTGESGGQPRNVASPDINTEDFSAAVDHLGLLANVDRNRIGIIGICGFGGMGLNATAVDKRIKAVVTTSMYDMSRAMAKGMNDALTLEERTKALESISLQRWEDAKTGQPAAGNRSLPVTLDSGSNPVLKEFFDYYRTPRGFHKNSINSNGSWTATNPMSFMNLPLMTWIKEISPRPILMIVGENAHSRYFSEDAFKQAAQPKELMILPGTNHVDLYDDMAKIPFAKIDTFFKTNLK